MRLNKGAPPQISYLILYSKFPVLQRLSRGNEKIACLQHTLTQEAMNVAYQVMGVTAAFFALLTAGCLRIRVGGKVYRALQKGTGALWMLIALTLVPGVTIGVNLLSIAVLAMLGIPGAALLQVIALMP